jgi:phosphate transport system permease protein
MTLSPPRTEDLLRSKPEHSADFLTDLGLSVEERGPVATPRRVSDFRQLEAAILGITALSSLAVVWVLFYQLTLLAGLFGFLACWLVCFLAMYWLVTALLIDRPAATDRTVTALVSSCAIAVIGLLLYIVIWVFLKGIAHFSIGFLYKSLADYQPADPHVFNDVGVGHAILGSLMQVFLAALFGVPLAVMTAIFLNEVGGFGVRFVRTIVTAMAGIPSIIAGVFIYALFIQPHYIGYSGFAASMALFVMLLPSVTRTTEEVLRVVPGGLREASLALGSSEWRTVRSVVLPTARSGLITAIVLGLAIVIGETAPLIYTAFGNENYNINPFHGAQGALPLVLWQNIQQAQAVVIQLAFTASFVLLSLVLILFVLARLIGRRSNHPGRLRRWVTAPVRWVRK